MKKQTSENTRLDLAVKKIVTTPDGQKSVVEFKLKPDTKHRFLSAAQNIRAKYGLSVADSKAAACVYLIEEALTIPEPETLATSTDTRSRREKVEDYQKGVSWVRGVSSGDHIYGVGYFKGVL